MKNKRALFYECCLTSFAVLQKSWINFQQGLNFAVRHAKGTQTYDSCYIKMYFFV